VPETAAFLKALTPEARLCLGAPQIQIFRFPFRVGRESRIGHSPDFPNSRRRHDSTRNNDLYLLENGPVLNVSREHFQIELRDNEYFLVDRGSACGTVVEGITVGKDRAGGERRLVDGDVIIVGTSVSPYVFKFVVARAGEPVAGLMTGPGGSSVDS
jgi:pSer/pThr/pTyr-binding forkhead associated (FHA) protein